MSTQMIIISAIALLIMPFPIVQARQLHPQRTNVIKGKISVPGKISKGEALVKLVK